MSDMSKAIAFVDEKHARGISLHRGTVTSVSGNTARVAISSGIVSATVWCACSAGDRVLLAYHDAIYDLIGKLGG